MSPTIKRLGFQCRLEMPSFVKNGQAVGQFQFGMRKSTWRGLQPAASRLISTLVCEVSRPQNGRPGCLRHNDNQYSSN
jgi:hypothetical protein